MRKEAVSGLYTGVTSASFATVKAKRKVHANEQQELKDEAARSGEKILTLIDERLADVSSRVWTLTEARDTEEHMKATLIGLRLYKDDLQSFRTQVVNLLRTGRDKTDE